LSQSFTDFAQALTSTVQLEPAQPDAQVHEYLNTASLQVPPFWHGDDAHSLTLTSQL
jgi:hypothetical protein